MRLWPLLLVYLTHLGQLQLQPGLLLQHPGWPWQASLFGLALLRTLPWALICWQLARLSVPLLPSAAALSVALWWVGFPTGFAQGEWQLALVQSATLAAWMAFPRYPVVLLAALYWPWHSEPGWLALLCLGAAWLAPADSPWRPLLALQLGLRLLGAPALPWEWVALVVLVSPKQPANRLILVGLVSLGLWEGSINRSLLIPLQECHLGLGAMLWPANLRTWATTRGTLYGVTAGDIELAQWLSAQPPGQQILVHSPLPEGRLQPYFTQRILERLSGRSDLGFPSQGESWVGHNLERGVCNADVVVLRGLKQQAGAIKQGQNWLAVAGQPASPLNTGTASWKPLQAVGPGSWVEVTVAGGPATLVEGPLHLTLPPGIHRLQLPVDTTEVRVQGLASHSLDLDKALENLHLVGTQRPADATSNSLLAAQLELRLDGSQSLWIPYLGAQFHRTDIPAGWRDNSPMTAVGRLLEPGQQLTFSCWLEVPEGGQAFECDLYWLAPQRRQQLLGRAQFTCRTRFPAKI